VSQRIRTSQPSTARAAARPTDRRDAGITLIEIIIAMTLSVVLIGVMVAVLVTSMNAADSTNQQAHDSLDLSTASAFLYRDAQATNVGVSTSSAQGCTASGTLVGSFKWTDKDTAGNVTTYVAVYSTVANAAPSKSFQLTRTLCTNGGAGTGVSVLGQAVATATLTCTSPSDCSTLPSKVSMHLVGAGTRNPMDDTLTANVRTSQVTDITKIGSVVSMLVLGQSGTCPGSSVSGTTSLTFNGTGIVSSTCSPQVTDATPAQLGSAVLTSGVADPISGNVTAPPLASCSNSGGNPAVSSQTGSSPLYFPGAFTISSPTYFPAGQYMFCDGLTVASGGSIEGSGVFIATKVKTISNKALTIATTATVNATAPTTGTYKNILFWVNNGAGSDLGLNGAVANYGGLVYAPTSVVTLAANGSGATQNVRSNLAGVVGKQIAFSGAGTLQLGAAPLDISLSPRTLANGTAGTAYSQLLSAPGITETAWTSLNLPAGLTIDNTGTISGTPTCSGTFSPEIAAYDANGLAAGAAYDGHYDRYSSQAGVQYGSLSIAPSVTLTNPGTPVKKGITLTATATNCSGTTKVSFQYAPTGTSTWTTACNNVSSATTTFTCSWSPNDGTYDLQAIATDGGLSTTSAKVTGILVDGTAPSITITSPANSATVSGSVAVTATVTDSGSGVNTVNISIGSATCTATNTSGNTWGCSVDTSTLTPGSFTLTVTATDKVGNSASATESLTVTAASTTCSASAVGPDVQACNGNGTAGTIDTGDKIVLVYSAAVKKSSITSAFATTDPLNIYVRFRDNSSKETVDFWTTNSADENDNQINLGVIDIGNGQIAKDQTVWFKATMTMAKDGKTITVTLGAIDTGKAANLTNGTAKNDMQWTPNNNAVTYQRHRLLIPGGDQQLGTGCASAVGLPSADAHR
jgi:hypothetical protein